jgi:pimeloyl-ACP methyl ester carboxylesterase
VVATPLSTDPDATRYVLLDLRDAAGRSVAFALARVPAVDGGPGTRLPVVFVLADAGPSGDASEADFLTGPLVGGLDREAVQIAVALRGGSLTARGLSPGGPAVTRASAVAADPYRADVTDLLALADRLDAVPRADTARVGAVGVGRGGAVALLAAERVPARFQAVAPIGAPTSLFDPTFRTAARTVLLGGTSRLPGAAALFAPVLALRDRQIGLAEARLRLLELSAVALADRLPATLAFHADPDEDVPPAHLLALDRLGQGTVDAPRRFVAIPGADRARLLDLNEVTTPLAAFLLDEL